MQGFALAALAKRHDAKAVAARELLQLQGMERALEPSAPFWGILERLSANAVHLTMTLLLVASPWLLLLTAPAHSSINWFFMRLMKRSFLAAQLALATLAALMLPLSLWLSS